MSVSSKTNGSSSAAALTDFTGLWKRVKTTNFEEIVGAQGASYVQRKLAASLTVMHTITMNPPTLDMFRLQVKLLTYLIVSNNFQMEMYYFVLCD